MREYQGYIAIEHTDESQESPVMIPVHLSVTVPEPVVFSIYLPMLVNGNDGRSTQVWMSPGHPR